MFPLNDEVHREKALQLAPRALHAGSISEKEYEQVRRKAKAQAPPRKSLGKMIAEG